MFKRGGVWTIPLTVNDIGLTVGAYGTGARPAIDGGIQYATGWTDETGGVWSHAYTTPPSAYEGVWDTVTGYGYAMAQDLAFCQSNEGAFYHDDGGNKLYVYLRVGDTLANLVARNTSYCVSVTAADVIIRDLELRYSLSPLYVSVDASDCEIDDVYIHHASYYGVESYAPRLWLHDCQIDKSGMNRGGGGITVQGPDCIIENSAWDDHGGHELFVAVNDSYCWGGPIQIGQGGDRAIVRGNICQSRHRPIGSDIGIAVEGGLAVYVDDAVIQNNVCYGGFTSCGSTSKSNRTQFLDNLFIDFQGCQVVDAVAGRLGTGIKVLSSSSEPVILRNTLASNKPLGIVTVLTCLYLQVDPAQSDENIYYLPEEPERIVAWFNGVDHLNYNLDEWRAIWAETTLFGANSSIASVEPTYP